MGFKNANLNWHKIPLTHQEKILQCLNRKQHQIKGISGEEDETEMVANVNKAKQISKKDNSTKWKVGKSPNLKKKRAKKDLLQEDDTLTWQNNDVEELTVSVRSRPVESSGAVKHNSKTNAEKVKRKLDMTNSEIQNATEIEDPDQLLKLGGGC